MPLASPFARTLALLALLAGAPAAAAGVDAVAHEASVSTLVPAPAQARALPGKFELRTDSSVQVPSGNQELLRTARIFIDELKRARGIRLPLSSAAQSPAPGAIVFELDPSPRADGEEAYVLELATSGVRVSARHPHGVFNGAMSLLQLATADGRRGPATLPALHIEDQPRFAWRGLMLDSARHMQSPAEIRHFIDAMALHKLDVLQWHLTDDQGWRLQIRKYPRLTEVGGWRNDAGAAGIDAATGKPVRYGGFYTQDEVLELVAYAAERYITIVPEIDMPGHAQAAIAAYPQLGTLGTTPPVSPDWGVHSYLFNVEDSTFGFLEDVLTEVMELFPGRFIHVGGDEAVKDQWKASPRVQQRMRELGVANETAMQAWLTARMQRFLAAHGRRLIGWDEILEGELPADAAVMSWRGVDGGIAATAKGHDSVLSPWPTLYFDNRQGTGTDEPPGRIRLISLEDVYRFDPLPPTMTPAQASHLLGVQGNSWTEHMRTAERVQWMSFPRAAAISEIGWSPAPARDWPDFLRRLPALYASYDALGVVHADSSFAVHAQTRYSHAPERADVALSTLTGAGEIRYTVDGREPQADSPLYHESMSLPLPATVSAASFAGSQRLSRTFRLDLSDDASRRRRSADLKLCSDGIALDLEDDAPATGDRAVFAIDIQNPCWIFEQAELDGVEGLVAAVGSVPFNFQIGDLKAKIKFPKPVTPAGELLVMLDGCDKEPIARLPLAPATQAEGVTVLPGAQLPALTGRHDLCLRFAQPRLEPMYALDWVQLQTASARKNTR